MTAGKLRIVILGLSITSSWGNGHATTYRALVRELAAAGALRARRGHGDMVMGHVVGSSVFNLLLIVGGMAAWRPLPLPASFVRFEVPAALAFALVLYPMLKGDLRISKREGGVLVLAFVAWLLFELYAIAH